MVRIDALQSRGMPSDEEVALGFHNHSDEFTDSELEFRIKSGPIDPEIQERLLDFFKTYRQTMKYLQDLELRNRKYEFFQYLQLKDVLDDLAAALIENSGDSQAQLMYIDYIEDYLKSTSIEIVKSVVFKILSSALKCLNNSYLYAVTFFSFPDRHQIEISLKTIVYHLRRGYQLEEKEHRLCLMEFKRTHDEAVRLENMLPNSNDMKYRLFIMLISLISLILAIVTILFQFS